MSYSPGLHGLGCGERPGAGPPLVGFRKSFRYDRVGLFVHSPIQARLQQHLGVVGLHPVPSCHLRDQD
ncbi:unnamed protein product [Sphagnum troendelagicum]|uniref:Uncharacterized protein n=1 Tax=Sphagnum troendelagicum TaxID=128251 RepID=A0ABP0TPH1_9BRYO